MKSIYRLWLVGLFFLAPMGLVQAALSGQEIEQRYYHLSKELRCLVCQNESLAESPAGLADDLRQEVRSQLQSGKTDNEIKRYLVDRYGYFVLYKPPLIGRTLWLWLAPLFIFLGLAGWVTVQLVRKGKSSSIDELKADQPLASDYTAQLEQIKKEFKQE